MYPKRRSCTGRAHTAATVVGPLPPQEKAGFYHGHRRAAFVHHLGGMDGDPLREELQGGFRNYARGNTKPLSFEMLIAHSQGLSVEHRGGSEHARRALLQEMPTGFVSCISSFDGAAASPRYLMSGGTLLG